MDAAAVARKIVQDPAQLRDDLAIWMQKCRWAGLSGLHYPDDYAVCIEPCQDFTLGEQNQPFILMGITLTRQKPRESRYFCLIFTITKPDLGPDRAPTYPISTVFSPSITQGAWTLRLATLDPIFVISLLQMKTPTTIVHQEDIKLDYTPTKPDQLSSGSVKEFKVLGGGDTTNSIVRVIIDTEAGLQRLVFKSYLHLFAHNIEAEKISHLHEVGFTATPSLEGILKLRWGKPSYTLLLVSQFVENDGDGGKPFWDHLQEYLTIIQSQKYVKSELQKIGPLAQLVGQTTREFHEALVKTKKGQVRQGNVDIHDVTAWEGDLKDNLMNAVQLWTQRQSLLFPHLIPENSAKISETLSTLVTHIESDVLFHPTLVPFKQPIHGDLHLGQFLYQSGPPPRFFVTDLEGDPQLPPKRRREARTVWFDLGGLLRALDYIAFFGTLEILKQQIPSYPWRAEDIFTLFLVRLSGFPLPPALEPHHWVGESTVAHALEWGEFIGTQILRGYGVKDKLDEELPVTFKLVRATSELNYELGFRGQNALVPLLGVLTIGEQWLQLKKKG